jgi:hypothetical protein
MPSIRHVSWGSPVPMWRPQCSVGTGGGVVTPGEAGWKVVAGRIVVVYEHPDGDGLLVARVTVWRRR